MSSREAETRDHNNRMKAQARDAIDQLVDEALARGEVGSLGVTVHIGPGKISSIYRETHLKQPDT